MTPPTPDSFLPGVLTYLEGLMSVVGYEGQDTSAQAQFLMEQVTLVALSTLILVAKENQDQLNQLMAEKKITEAVRMLSEQFSDEEMKQAFLVANQKVMAEFFTQIRSELTPDQHRQLQAYLLQASQSQS